MNVHLYIVDAEVFSRIESYQCQKKKDEFLPQTLISDPYIFATQCRRPIDILKFEIYNTGRVPINMGIQ